jgi:hypothetical protein
MSESAGNDSTSTEKDTTSAEEGRTVREKIRIWVEKWYRLITFLTSLAAIAVSIFSTWNSEKAFTVGEKAHMAGQLLQDQVQRHELLLDKVNKGLSKVTSDVDLLKNWGKRMSLSCCPKDATLPPVLFGPGPMLGIASPKPNATVGGQAAVSGWVRTPKPSQYVFIILEATFREASPRWYMSDMVQVEGTGLWAGVARLDKFQVKPGEKVRIMAELSGKSDQYKLPVPGPLPGGPKGAEESRVSVLVERKPRY